MAWFLVISGALTIGGVALAWLARRSGRQGTDPHCGRCNYNLTGLESSRCPECGSDLGHLGAVLSGRRVVSRGRMAAALGLILMGGIAALPATALRNVNWRPWLPTWWLMWESGSADDVRCSAAMEELGRRFRAGALSDSARSTLIEACLTEQGRPVIRRIGNRLYGPTHFAVDVLGEAYVRGLLSEAQADQLFRQSFELKLTGPVSYEGRGRAIKCEITSRIPGFLLAYKANELEYAIDSGPAEVMPGMKYFSTLFPSRTSSTSILLDGLGSGKHSVRVRTQIEFYRLDARPTTGYPLANTPATRLFERLFEVSHEFELPAENAASQP